MYLEGIVVHCRMKISNSENIYFKIVVIGFEKSFKINKNL